MTAHFLACSWYYLGTQMFHDLMNSSGEDTWVIYHDLDQEHHNVWTRYNWAFHWAVSQFFGEGLLSPRNHYERLFIVLTLLFTFMASTAFVSSFTTSMTRIQLVASKQSSQLAALRRFLVDKNIPRGLSVRVTRNAQHALLEQKRNAPE